MRIAIEVPAGLSEREAQARRAAGRGNTQAGKGGRTYLDIVRNNLFTLFNNILFVIGIALIALGRANDAMTSVGIGLVNALISTLQEMRAKRLLDRIALLTRSTVRVVRDGHLRDIDPAEIVEGDVLRIEAGDQIVVDGAVVGDTALEIDESLLTGEPTLIRKGAGDTLLSGSFCVTGVGWMGAERVGSGSLANQLTAAARELSIAQTPLQKQVNLLVKLMMLFVGVFSILILAAAVLEGVSQIRLVQIAAVLTGQVPYGLFLLIVAAYALGAAKVGREGALVQQTNAVESLSNIDVLCTDKTGTLTTNRLRLHDVHLLGSDNRDEILAALGDFVRSASPANRTSEAILAGTDGEVRLVSDEVPFASSRKWSGVAFNQTERHGLYVLGAPEILAAHIATDVTSADGALTTQTREWSEQGLRVLLFAHAPDVVAFRDTEGELTLPRLVPLALVSLRDELRPMVRETIAGFRELGIALKVISGDSPYTVAALARQAGLPDDIKVVSGPELAGMTDAAFDQAAAEATVFGRVTPQQKEQLVDALLRRGNHVAMIGDGVNDVLSLKKASLGIAMQSGSSATRNVADMVLLGDSFAALRPAFGEGQRIISGLSSALFLFLARSLTTTLLIIGVTILGLSFPFDPAQVALTTFTVGIPAFFLTLWAQPRPLAPNLLRSLARFVLPVALLTMLMGVGLYLDDFNRARPPVDGAAAAADGDSEFDRLLDHYSAYTGVKPTDEDFADAFGTIAAQGTLSIFISHTAFLLLLFLEPPIGFFTGWRREVSKDKRPGMLAVVLILTFQVFYFVPRLGSYFGLLEKPPAVYAGILAAVVVWMFAIRTIWRHQLLERLLGLEPELERMHGH